MSEITYDALKNKGVFTNIPILTLDERWYRLVNDKIKTDEIAYWEKQDAITGNETISNKGFVVGSYIDINVFSVVGDSRREISNTSKELTFTIKLADNLINTDSTITRTYKVVRVHGDETAIIDAEFDAATNKITFKSDKFSTYAVIYSDVKNTNVDDKTNVDNKTDVDNGAAVEPVTGGGATATGDKNNTALYVVLIVLSVVGREIQVSG